jgi:hypothetical protein
MFPEVFNDVLPIPQVIKRQQDYYEHYFRTIWTAELKDRVCASLKQKGDSFPPMALRPILGQGLLIIEASRYHSDTSQSAGVLWTSEQLDAETSTWQHTTLTRDRYPCHQWGSNLQPQQADGLWPSQTTRRHRVLFPTGLYTKLVNVSYISRTHVAEIQTDRPRPDMSKPCLASLTCVQSWRKILQLRKYSLILKEILLVHIDTFTDV